MNILKRIFEPVSIIKGLFSIVVFQALVRSVLVILGTELLRVIIQSIESAMFENIQLYLLYFLGLLIVSIVNEYFVNHMTLNRLGPIMYGLILNKYMEKFFLMSSTYTEKIGTGRLINIIERGAHSWFFFLLEISRPATIRIGNLIFSIIYVLLLDVYYGLGILVVIALLLFLHIKMQHEANKYRRERKEVNIDISRSLVRHIQAKQEIIGSQKNDQESKVYLSLTSKIADINTKVMKFKFYSDSISRIITDGIKVVAILSVSYGLFGGFINVAFFVTLIIILGLLDNSLYSLSRLYISLSDYYINIEKLWNIFDDAPAVQDINEGDDFYYTTGNIELKNVSYSYNEQGADVLSNLSLTLQGGNKIALVGPSGSGKSTLVKLIAGYIRPDSGTISIDGQDLSEVSLKSYYKHIGYLTQEPSVFDGTIRENLLYAVDQKEERQQSFLRRQETCEDESEDALHDTLILDSPGREANSLATHLQRQKQGKEDSSITRSSLNLNDAVDEAIKLSKCEFIYDLPNGLDTEIGERGVRLSGGQRQRLSIAKIFLKNPEIIILDEPTSALDSFSEEAITQAMNELFKGRTVIIIAHRLQTVKHADDIILLDQGQVLERGTHDELVSQGGQYAKMLELQSGF